MKRIRLINLILIMFCCCNMLAQNITVTGQVVDVTSEPIIGASVVVKGTTNGTITDFDGNFTLSVQKGETLHISYIGYVAQDVKVMGNQPVKVVMAEDTETLDEVVVVGTSMKKSDLTGAVASVSSKVLEEKPVTNVNQALQGRVAGVFISQPTRPTDDASIKIRGINTINGSTDPIYVIDGMVMDNSFSVNELFNSQYKLVVYKDSMSCTPCYIETLSKWNRILNKYNKDVLAIFFILSPSEEEEEDFRLLLRYSDFKYPVLIDNEQMFLKLNKQIPNNKKLHTFLLNSNNDVIFIGNPLENGRIEDLFEKQIQ